MSKETLFTAARRALRDFSIDSQRGGIITERTEKSFHTLRREIEKEERRLRTLYGPSLEPDENEERN